MSNRPGPLTREPRRGAAPNFEKRERRTFCPCELCCLRFGRMLYPRDPPSGAGEPLRFPDEAFTDGELKLIAPDLFDK